MSFFIRSSNFFLLDSIGSALVPSTPFDIVSLVDDDLTRCTSRV